MCVTRCLGSIKEHRHQTVNSGCHWREGKQWMGVGGENLQFLLYSFLRMKLMLVKMPHVDTWLSLSVCQHTAYPEAHTLLFKKCKENPRRVYVFFISTSFLCLVAAPGFPSLHPRPFLRSVCWPTPFSISLCL